MFKAIIDLTVCACMIRGIFEEDTYTKSGACAVIVADGIKNPVTRDIVTLATVWTVAPLIAGVEGARAFYRDGKKLAERV